MASRRATYPAATRLAELMLVLAARPQGIPTTAIAEVLNVSERTQRRYVQALLDAPFAAIVDVTPTAIRLTRDWREIYS